MKKVTLFDMNNLAMRVVHIKDVKTVDKDTKKVLHIDWAYWKLVMFTNIYSSLYQVPTKTITLCADSKQSWRYDVWPRYKEDRKLKNSKDASEFPWGEYYQQYDQFIADIRAHFPVKMIQIDKTEADDIIGVIAREVSDPVEVISTDKDFLQLSCDRIKIYNPMKREHVAHPNPAMFLIEQCMIGQKKDSIFNIKTPLDYPLGKRKPGFGPAAFEKVMEYGIKQWLIDNKLTERFKFNKQLMDFAEIPQTIQDTIMAEYNDYKYPDPSKMWEYIDAQGWPEIIENFTQVENKFLELY